MSRLYLCLTLAALALSVASAQPCPQPCGDANGVPVCCLANACLDPRLGCCPQANQTVCPVWPGSDATNLTCCDSCNNFLNPSFTAPSASADKVCCPSGQVCPNLGPNGPDKSNLCCRTSCLPTLFNGANVTICCPKESICGRSCCLPDTKCINDQCCPSSQVCISATGVATCCSAPSSICTTDGTCCNTTQLCGTVCCPAGQTCQSGQCTPTTMPNNCTAPNVTCAFWPSFAPGDCCRNGTCLSGWNPFPPPGQIMNNGVPACCPLPNICTPYNAPATAPSPICCKSPCALVVNTAATPPTTSRTCCPWTPQPIPGTNKKVCCPDGTTVQPDGSCCKQSQLCPGPNGPVCCPAGSFCQPVLGTTIRICCPDGTAAQPDGTCCNTTQLCGTVCCPAGQTCQSGQCTPTTMPNNCTAPNVTCAFWPSFAPGDCCRNGTCLSGWNPFPPPGQIMNNGVPACCPLPNICTPYNAPATAPSPICCKSPCALVVNTAATPPTTSRTCCPWTPQPIPGTNKKVCCPDGTTVQPDGSCCKQSQLCPGPNGPVCCPAGSFCQPVLGTTIRICCPDGTAAQPDGTCCNTTQLCGTVCCPAGQTCQSGQCTPTTMPNNCTAPNVTCAFWPSFAPGDCCRNGTCLSGWNPFPPPGQIMNNGVPACCPLPNICTPYNAPATAPSPVCCKSPCALLVNTAATPPTTSRTCCPWTPQPIPGTNKKFCCPDGTTAQPDGTCCKTTQLCPQPNNQPAICCPAGSTCNFATGQCATAPPTSNCTKPNTTCAFWPSFAPGDCCRNATCLPGWNPSPPPGQIINNGVTACCPLPNICTPYNAPATAPSPVCCKSPCALLVNTAATPPTTSRTCCPWTPQPIPGTNKKFCCPDGTTAQPDGTCCKTTQLCPQPNNQPAICCPAGSTCNSATGQCGTAPPPNNCTLPNTTCHFWPSLLPGDCCRPGMCRPVLNPLPPPNGIMLNTSACCPVAKRCRRYSAVPALKPIVCCNGTCANVTWADGNSTRACCPYPTKVVAGVRYCCPPESTVLQPGGQCCPKAAFYVDPITQRQRCCPDGTSWLSTLKVCCKNTNICPDAITGLKTCCKETYGCATFAPPNTPAAQQQHVCCPKAKRCQVSATKWECCTSSQTCDPVLSSGFRRCKTTLP